MDKAEVDRWLGSYVEAWKTYDPDLIGSLFADDIKYRYMERPPATTAE
jgi:hypothetical protein